MVLLKLKHGFNQRGLKMCAIGTFDRCASHDLAHDHRTLIWSEVYVQNGKDLKA